MHETAGHESGLWIFNPVSSRAAERNTYSVNEANKTYTIRYEGSSYPNLEGTEQTRSFTITGDELRVTNPAPSVGGPPCLQARQVGRV